MTRVFVAGATGAIGKRLVPQLVDSGHDVVAMTRSATKAQALRRQGIETVVADGLDRGAVIDAVTRTEPEIVIHEMTGLSGVTNIRNFDKQFAATNRLRTEGTDHLLVAAKAAGARRFLAQSFGNWYEHTGSWVKTEEDPFVPDPPVHQRRSFEAIQRLEGMVSGAEGIEGVVLRYAALYGPGTDLSADGPVSSMVRKRRFPMIGDGAGVWSFIHVDDAAGATVAAAERGAPGIYNVADDDPAPVSEWLPELARALAARPPRHLPVWLGRLLAGDVVVSMFTENRGAANGKAKRELGWTPRYTSWREGFRNGLADRPPGTTTGVRMSSQRSPR